MSSIEPEKICKKCRLSKPAGKFPKAPRGTYGRAGSCHSCKYKSRYYADLPVSREKARNKKAAYIKNNPEGYSRNKIAESKRYHAAVQNQARDLTGEQWTLIKSFYRDCCAYCGKPSEKLVRDRIRPVSKGGGLTAPNVVPACVSCSASKQDRIIQPRVMHPVTADPEQPKAAKNP